MKALILLSLTLVSLNTFASSVGEDKKSDCSFANQSSKREPKSVDDKSADAEPKKEVKTIAK